MLVKRVIKFIWINNNKNICTKNLSGILRGMMQCINRKLFMNHILNPLQPNNRQSKEDNSLNSIKKKYTRSNLLKCYFKLHRHPISNQSYIREKKIILINKYLIKQQ